MSCRAGPMVSRGRGLVHLVSPGLSCIEAHTPCPCPHPEHTLHKHRWRPRATAPHRLSSNLHALTLLLPTQNTLTPQQVEAEDYSAEVCTLASAAQSFTKADGQVVRLLLPAPAHLLPNKVGPVRPCITHSMLCVFCVLG